MPIMNSQARGNLISYIIRPNFLFVKRKERRNIADMSEEKVRTYICIDLKSFYASVECVERGLDPFTTSLVVADPTRSKSTICLAITPYMKTLGVKNRCRIHEIPPEIEYITAMPRMQLYIDYSAWIYSIYLRYVSPEDIHVYSVDECFIDVTDYLKLYHMTAIQLARELMGAVLKETGITATAGIGTNLYLAKVAMDIVAKHTPEHIGILDESAYRRQLWNHSPLTDFWMVGPGTARTLARYGILTMGDIARTSLTSEDMLFRSFGIDAELLIDHAWGQESCTMWDIKHYQTKSHSLSNGQVLMRNYAYEEARVVVREMADQLVLDMVDRGVVTDSFTLWISYDHKTGMPGSGGSIKLDAPSSSSRRILAGLDLLYQEIADRMAGIRRLGICANHIEARDYLQFDLFSDPLEQAREQSLQQAILQVHKRYGKNALLRGCNLLDCSTLMERNQQIGGHRA